jgi:hypothetical protein
VISFRRSIFQILTIKDLLVGKEIDRPPYGANVTFKKAVKVEEEEQEMDGLPFYRNKREGSKHQEGASFGE